MHPKSRGKRLGFFSFPLVIRSPLCYNEIDHKKTEKEQGI